MVERVPQNTGQPTRTIAQNNETQEDANRTTAHRRLELSSRVRFTLAPNCSGAMQNPTRTLQRQPGWIPVGEDPDGGVSPLSGGLRPGSGVTLSRDAGGMRGDLSSGGCIISPRTDRKRSNSSLLISPCSYNERYWVNCSLGLGVSESIFLRQRFTSAIMQAPTNNAPPRAKPARRTWKS